MGGNTNKFREKKLALWLHHTTPPQTPQFSHYTRLQWPDKRVPPARVIGNQVSTPLCIVHHQSQPRWTQVGLKTNTHTHTRNYNRFKELNASPGKAATGHDLNYK